MELRLELFRVPGRCTAHKSPSTGALDGRCCCCHRCGCAFRYKTLPDGRRQILNYALPSDLIGLQGAVNDEMQHSVEALTDVTLCVFPREKLWDLYKDYPALAFDITWLAAREEQMLLARRKPG